MRQARLTGSVRVSVPVGRSMGGGWPWLRSLTWLSLPSLQMWMSVPSTASCVKTGGARTALVATAAPAPRVSACSRTRRPVKVQGPRHAAWVCTCTDTRTCSVWCTHWCTQMYAACSVHTHTLRHTHCMLCAHSHMLKNVYTRIHTHIHTQKHIYILRLIVITLMDTHTQTHVPTSTYSHFAHLFSQLHTVTLSKTCTYAYVQILIYLHTRTYNQRLIYTHWYSKHRCTPIFTVIDTPT